MQGQQSGIGFFTEVGYEHGSTSNDGSLDQQMFWNSIGNSGQQSPLPNFMVSSSSDDTHIQYVNGVNNHHVQQPFNGWDFRESSGVLQADIQQHGSSNVLSNGNFNVSNLQRNGVEDLNETLLLPNSGSHHVPQDINMNSSGLVEDDDCQVLEGPPIYKQASLRRTQPIQFASSSSDPFGGSSDGPRLSCKRKILEGNVEQPFDGGIGTGSSSYVQHPVNPMTGSHSLNLMDQVNPGYGSSTTRPVANESMPLLVNSGTLESSRRNSRSRMNRATHQQGSLSSNNMFSIESATGNINLSSSQHSLMPLPPQNSLTTRPPTSMAANTNSSLHRNPQPRWNSSIFPSSGVSFEPSNSMGVPRNISDHPMFSQQSAPSWSLAGGGNVNNPGNVASSSQNAAGANTHIPHQYPSRLSESVRRALLSAADAGSRVQNSNHPSIHTVPSSSQGVSVSSGSRRHGRHSHSRQAMLLERHLDGALGIPPPVRALASYNDGRTRLMSEIRNALELVRRGEGLRLQDAMILNQPVFFGMMDIHDRHRDMRLDVDNMSYEELLALEDRIGSVNTGLSEESIVKQLKKKKHVRIYEVDEMETEPCCICREEYNDGEDVGTLDCGHDFHGECIKQWLMHKNLCPICKTTGLTK